MGWLRTGCRDLNQWTNHNAIIHFSHKKTKHHLNNYFYSDAFSQFLENELIHKRVQIPALTALTWKTPDWWSAFPSLPPSAPRPASAHWQVKEPWHHRWNRRGRCKLWAAHWCKGTNQRPLLCAAHTPRRCRGPGGETDEVSSCREKKTHTQKQFGFISFWLKYSESISWILLCAEIVWSTGAQLTWHWVNLCKLMTI